MTHATGGGRGLVTVCAGMMLERQGFPPLWIKGRAQWFWYSYNTGIWGFGTFLFFFWRGGFWVGMDS